MPRALLASAFSIGILVCGCAADGGGTTDPSTGSGESIGEYLQSISDLPSPAPAKTEGSPSSPTRDGDYSCTTQNYSETRQYDKIVALAANSESLWPGAIVAGNSVYTGLFTQLVFDRAPLAASISLENLAGKQSMLMEHPSLSAFRDGIGRILAQDVTGSTPADIYSEVEQVYSEQQLSLALGASVAYAGAKVSASFDWSNKQVMSRYVVNYMQAYYTVDVDQPRGPEDLFGDGVTTDVVKANVGAGGPPVYVSSITYGRMIIFTFESQYSGEELGAALDFAYKGGVDVSGSVSVSYKNIITSSKITAFILGGDGGMAAQSIDSYDALIQFIKSGGNYSKDSPGAPIAYKLAYLKDNSPARLSYTTDYTVRNCVRVGQQIQVTLSSIQVNNAGGDAGSDLELYGTVKATARPKGGSDGPAAVLLGKDADHAVVIGENQTWPIMGTIADEILDVVPQAGSVITLSAHLDDVDVWPNANDNICDDAVQVTFEQGWNRDVKIHCTGSSADVVVNLHIEPI